MKVKKYCASSMPEAMKQIRSELGNEAVILNSRVIHSKGIFGFFKKRSIEVIAALDEQPGERLQQPQWQQNEPPAVMTEVPYDRKKEETVAIHKEIADLKKLLVNTAEQREKESTVLPDAVQYLADVLREQDINRLIITEIIHAALQWYEESEEDKTRSDVLKWAHAHMVKEISHLSFSVIPYQKKYVTVVGPTGVGKTTTLAKLAADALLNAKKKIAFITTDTYRIAAIEQLKTYANILNVPLEVCYNRKDFQEAVTKLAGYDVVFIDTAGRNFHRSEYVEDLQQLIDFNESMETFLVLSLTAKQRDMEKIFQQFQAIDIDRIIFTKADETFAYGAMFNSLHSWQKPVAYITNGQDVPDDIVSATPERIVTQILGVNEYE